MDERLQKMLDHFEIRETLHEYCHGLDRMDQIEMASVYAKDSYDEHGPYSTSGPEFVQGVMDRMKAGASVADQHMLGQSFIKVHGDTAGADTYFIFVGRKVLEDGSEILMQLGGRYVDTFVKEDGKWKVKNRVCVRDWSITHPITTDWLKGVKWVQGKRSNEDPSFAALGLKHSGIPGV
jgi:hypothetical protein